MFVLAITGLCITVYGILIFRLIFIMITYMISPIALVLCVFPQTREFGGKLFKIFFESVFCLLFFDMSLVVCFKVICSNNLGLNNPLGFGLTVICLAAPLAVYKVLWNPISGAITGAMGGGISAITGAVGGGMGIGGMAKGLGMGGGGKGGMGAATTGAGAAGKGTGGVTDKVAEAGMGMAQADSRGFGAPVGLAVTGGALAFKGGKKGVQAMAKKYGEYKQRKEALGGAFGVVEANKPGAPSHTLGEKHKTIGGMYGEAEKEGLGTEFSRKDTDFKQNMVVQHGEDKKQQAFMGTTGRSAEDWQLLQKNPASLNKWDREWQGKMKTSLRQTGQEAQLQKKFNRIENGRFGTKNKLDKIHANSKSKADKGGKWW